MPRKSSLSHISKEFLEEEYNNKHKSSGLIAEELGVNENTLRYYMNSLGIILKGPKIRNNKIGKVYEKLKVIGLELLEDTNANRLRWICQCECGEVVLFSNKQLGLNKSCGRCRVTPSNSESPYFKGYGRISRNLWNLVRLGAIKRDIEFNISIKYMWELFLIQEGKCALSGIDLQLPVSKADKIKGNYTASFDRIDSSKGYVEGNCQWVHKDLNFMKQDFSPKEFFRWCKLIYEHNDLAAA